jgi:hypothetical protein
MRKPDVWNQFQVQVDKRVFFYTNSRFQGEPARAFYGDTPCKLHCLCKEAHCLCMIYAAETQESASAGPFFFQLNPNRGKEK